jgi:hypothetical protein
VPVRRSVRTLTAAAAVAQAAAAGEESSTGSSPGGTSGGDQNAKVGVDPHAGWEFAAENHRQPDGGIVRLGAAG